jgi:hypothetical protein
MENSFTPQRGRNLSRLQRHISQGATATPKAFSRKGEGQLLKVGEACGLGHRNGRRGAARAPGPENNSDMPFEAARRTYA